jgi:hypothetical protein
MSETGGGLAKTGTFGFGKDFDMDEDFGLDSDLDLGCDRGCDFGFRSILDLGSAGEGGIRWVPPNGEVKLTIGLTEDAASSTESGNGTSHVTWGRETSLRSLGGKTFVDPSP